MFGAARPGLCRDNQQQKGNQDHAHYVKCEKPVLHFQHPCALPNRSVLITQDESGSSVCTRITGSLTRGGFVQPAQFVAALWQAAKLKTAGNKTHFIHFGTDPVACLMGFHRVL